MGQSFFSLVDNSAEGEAFFEKCRASPPEDFAQQKVGRPGLQVIAPLRCLCFGARMLGRSQAAQPSSAAKQPAQPSNLRSQRNPHMHACHKDIIIEEEVRGLAGCLRLWQACT